MQKIGILGSGSVAKTLGNGFLKHGYEVKLGTRSPEKLTDWLAQTNGKGQIGTFAEAAAFGDILVLAVKGQHAHAALTLAGADHLAGKTILDAANPIDESQKPVGGALRFFTPQNSSLLEQLQEAFPDAHFVKAFNSVGAGLMVNPQLPGGQPTMFICGASAEAKAEATQLIELLGWEAEDMGGPTMAGCIEQLCVLWCAPGFQRNQWTHAFKLLKS